MIASQEINNITTSFHWYNFGSFLFFPLTLPVITILPLSLSLSPLSLFLSLPLSLSFALSATLSFSFSPALPSPLCLHTDQSALFSLPFQCYLVLLASKQTRCFVYKKNNEKIQEEET